MGIRVEPIDEKTLAQYKIEIAQNAMIYSWSCA